MCTHVATLFRRGCNESSDRTDFQLFILARHQSRAYIGCTVDKMCLLHMAGCRQLCMPTLLGNVKCLKPISASPTMSCSLTNNYDNTDLPLSRLRGSCNCGTCTERSEVRLSNNVQPKMLLFGHRATEKAINEKCGQKEVYITSALLG